MLDDLELVLDYLKDNGTSGLVWTTLDITYAPPFVERAWTPFQIGEIDYRFCIHRIHPCDEDLALYHPHPWPSAVKLLQGTYRHHVGIQIATGEIRTLTTHHLEAGCAYQMTDPVGYHRVVPVGSPSLSAMLMGPLYKHTLPSKKPPKQPPLSEEKRLNLLVDFTRALSPHLGQP